MKILKMRATFGKLQSAELALGEGLNVIEAPNEGGKSTWSAFLRAMLYGINTKERDRQGYLAEKNRYQPWSGAAMEGSVELLWQGRSVTLRRGPKGSTPFGRFEAVYTGTAELVPGLTGDNAGETLTGVPREVFERSAFVGQGGAAIDGAPALEARIAALASSGEEDVSYSQVERRLRDWLNRRKHNKTGLIPRLEEELADVEETLARQSKAFRLAQEARRELERLQAEHRLLESERDAHLSRAMAQRRARWEAAQAALAEAQAQVDGLEAERTRHGAPPDRDTLKRAQEELNALNTLHANRKLAESQLEEARAAEAEARASAEDPLFPGLTPDEAWERAGADAEAAGGRPKTAGLYAGGILLLAVGAVGLIAPLCGTLPLPLGGSLPAVLTTAGVSAALAIGGAALLIAAGLGIAYMVARRSIRGRRAIAAWSLTKAPLHRLHSLSAAAQIAHSMATMLTAGLPVPKALDVTGNVISNYTFALAVQEVKQKVERGRTISESKGQIEYFPKMLTEMVGVGEQSGSLEETLDVIGEYFDNEVEVTTARLLSVLEPIITIALAVIVVVLLLAVYLPLFTLYGGM